MALLNYTTEKDPEQTIAEIQKMLTGHGISAMMTEYDGRQISAVSFRMEMHGKPVGFRLPCNWRAVLEIIKQPPHRRNLRLRGITIDHQATRVAWRIMYEWVRAQLALVDVNMVTIPQVFLPYTIMKDNRTLAEHVESDPKFLLGGNTGDDQSANAL